MATTMIEDRYDERLLTGLNWPALLGGTVIALAIEVTLGLLGAGIGFSAIDPGSANGASAGGLGMGALIWWTSSSVLALAAGAYSATLVARRRRAVDGVMHGLAIWGLTLLLTFYLLTSAVGGIVGGAFRAVGSMASAAASGASVVTPTVAKAAGVDETDVDAQVSALLDKTPQDPAAMTPEQSRKAIVAELPAMAKGGEEGRAAEQRIALIVAAQNKIAPDEAMARVQQAKQEFLSAKQSAIDTAIDAGAKGADLAAGTAFALFVVMLLGAGAAAAGGAVATRRTI